MDCQEKMKPMVLARFPRIRGSKHPETRRESLMSRGRLIGQATSFKLLAVAALLLIAVAVVPLAIGTSKKAADVSTEAVAAPIWQPEAPTLATEATVPAAGPIAEVSPPPVASPSPMPKILPRPEIANTTPTTVAAETPTMSAWPNPDHLTTFAPDAGGQEPETGDRPSMANRPNDYDQGQL